MANQDSKNPQPKKNTDTHSFSELYGQATTPPPPPKKKHSQEESDQNQDHNSQPE